MSPEVEQKLAGMFRRGIPNAQSDQFNLLVASVVAMLVEQHGKTGAAKCLNAILDRLSKQPQR